MKKHKTLFIILFILLVVFLQPSVRESIQNQFLKISWEEQLGISAGKKMWNFEEQVVVSLKELEQKEFDGEHSVLVLGEKASFRPEELILDQGAWKTFSDLDWLNRVGVANAMLGSELLPTEKRGSLSHVKPTGWKNKKIQFNGTSDYLYNRSHLIAYSLSGEDDNVKNLFTGTRALNANFASEKNSMVYYEKMILDYIRTTHHHVRYRVTPVFRGVELVARGVRLEAQSIEDDSLSFDVYLFNIQPDYQIDYLTGASQKK
ncbi:DNA/RNA non-specific endonuclease [Streptococcus sp. O1]|uniref:DNA/RNA non-specific endonuclease n=1 Tax=Streptococcus sp. O1 TaxID=2928735 RepID=UPI00211B48A5|nr:DNA/RNA non-specific endonuclease [Streptococcus sp. O1]